MRVHSSNFCDIQSWFYTINKLLFMIVVTILLLIKSSDLKSEEIIKKLSEFKKKIKCKYEVISVFSNKDLLKVKQLLIKNVN
mgnify:CR=1 FL=1